MMERAALIAASEKYERCGMRTARLTLIVSHEAATRMAGPTQPRVRLFAVPPSGATPPAAPGRPAAPASLAPRTVGVVLALIAFAVALAVAWPARSPTPAARLPAPAAQRR